MTNPVSNNPQLEEVWNDLNYRGELKPADRIILKAVFEDPDASIVEIAERVGMAYSTVYKRLQKPACIKARQAFEGTMQEQLEAAVQTYSRWLLKMINNAEGAIERKIDAICAKFGEDQEGRNKALTLLAKGSDPWLIHELGKTAVAILAKQAELALKDAERNKGGSVLLKGVTDRDAQRAAAEALANDPMMQPDGEAPKIEDL